MSLTFVIGRAGSGKTRRCFDAIVSALREDPLGPPIYWILPRQATFSAQRDLACNSGLGGFCRARIVSFEEFGRDVFETCGGDSIPLITPLGRQMILGHLLRKLEPRLQLFGGSARRVGLAAQLDQTFAELERGGKGSEELAAMIRSVEKTAGTSVDANSLLAKLHDIALVYEEYNVYLGQERLDQHRRAMHVLSSIEQCEFLRKARVYVDGFLEFDENDRRLLVALAKTVEKLEICLLMHPGSRTLHMPRQAPDDLSLFHRTEQAYRRLFLAMADSGVEITPPVLLKDQSRFAASPSLAMLERTFDKEAPPQTEVEGIEFVEAADRRPEADAIARRIRALLSEGFRLRDIALLTRDLDPYHGPLSESFAEHGIPFFADRRRSAAHHPLLRVLRSILQIARFDWPTDAVLTLMKTGLAGATDGECDALENYLLGHFIRGSKGWCAADPWDDQPPIPMDEEDLQVAAPSVDQIRRRLVNRLAPAIDRLGNTRISGPQQSRQSAPTPSPGTPGEGRGGGLSAAEQIKLLGQFSPSPPHLDPPPEYQGRRQEKTPRVFAHAQRPRPNDELPLRVIAGELFGALDALGVQKTMERWMASDGESNELEHAVEHQRVWDELVELFEQMVSLLGDERMSLERFSEVLESGLEEFDLALTPPTVDQVLVGQVDRTRTPNVRAVFLLGLSEGEFPQAPADKSILSDRERRELQKLSIDLDPDTRRRLLDEQLLGYIAMTRASERLYLSRTAVDHGRRAASPSIFWTRLRQLFPSAPLHTIQPALGLSAEQIATPKQLVTSLMRWMREPSKDPAENQTWESLYQWLATRPVNDDAIDTVRYRSWKALSYANTAQLSPEMRKGLFPGPLTVSASQLESFARCPFSHFLRYGLRLRPRQSQQIGHSELARLYSRMLSKLIDRAIRAKRAWDGPDAPIDSAAIDVCLTEIDDVLSTHLARSGARGKYLLDRTRRTLVEFLAAQREMMRRGRFRPAFSALTFGTGSSIPALQLTSEKGTELSVQGRIDRVDLLEGGRDVCVMSYRLKVSSLSLDAIYNGLSLQLLTSLLALQAHGPQLTGMPLGLAGAFALQVPRSIQEVAHPEDPKALAPTDPRFHLATKPRGIFSRRQLYQFDSDLQTGRSDVLHAFVKKDGELGSAASSDVAEEAEFQSLLKYVERQLGALADRISAGDIAIAPYLLGGKSPCPHCDYQSVCRFAVPVNSFRKLKAAGRTGVLSLLREDGDE
jgi:ATP-dependent helicase/nuclease subunit B